jgi:hypothetical protein
MKFSWLPVRRTNIEASLPEDDVGPKVLVRDMNRDILSEDFPTSWDVHIFLEYSCSESWYVLELLTYSSGLSLGPEGQIGWKPWSVRMPWSTDPILWVEDRHSGLGHYSLEYNVYA